MRIIREEPKTIETDGARRRRRPRPPGSAASPWNMGPTLSQSPQASKLAQQVPYRTVRYIIYAGTMPGLISSWDICRPRVSVVALQSSPTKNINAYLPKVEFTLS